MMQGQWVQCPNCRQATAPGYACQRCGAPMQQAPMQQAPMQQMPMQQMGQMPYGQPQKSGMGAGGIVLIVLGIFVVLGGILLVGGILVFRASANDSSSSYSSPYSSPTPVATTTSTVAAGPYTDNVGRYSVAFPSPPNLESSTDD